jgi:predicted SnoaL-like aldol condensation-catalyzing enzyme
MHRSVTVFVVAIAALAGSQSSVVRAQGNAALEKNKTLAQRFHLDIIGKGNLALADEIIAPDCAIHLPSGTAEAKGPERAKRVAGGDLRAYPKGIKFVHDLVIAEGDVVSFHWTLAGTRDSGETETLEGIDVVRLQGGKIAEMWIEYHTVKK